MIIVDTKYNVSAEAVVRLKTACKLIESGAIDEMPIGRTEIDGADIYVNVSEYETHKNDFCLWEAHRKYADVQYMIRGSELIACAPIDKMQVTQEYSEKTDVVLGYAEGNNAELSYGRYIILFPDTAHCPGISAGLPENVKKAVIKVKL